MANIPAEGFAASIFESPNVLGEAINYDMAMAKAMPKVKPEKKESITPRNLNSIANYELIANKLENQARQITQEMLEKGATKEEAQLKYDQLMGTIGSIAQAGLDSKSFLDADANNALKYDEGFRLTQSGSEYVNTYNKTLDDLYKTGVVTSDGVFYKDPNGNLLPIDDTVISNLVYKSQVKKQLDPYKWVEGLSFDKGIYEDEYGKTTSSVNKNKVRNNIYNSITKGRDGDAILMSMAQAYFKEMGVNNPSDTAIIDLLTNNREELIDYSVNELTNQKMTQYDTSLRREGDSELNIQFGSGKWKSKVGVQPLGQTEKLDRSIEVYNDLGMPIPYASVTGGNDKYNISGVAFKPVKTSVPTSEGNVRADATLDKVFYGEDGQIYGEFYTNVYDRDGKYTGNKQTQYRKLDNNTINDVRTQLGLPQDVTIVEFIDENSGMKSTGKKQEKKTQPSSNVPQASKAGATSR